MSIRRSALAKAASLLAVAEASDDLIGVVGDEEEEKLDRSVAQRPWAGGDQVCEQAEKGHEVAAL